MPLGAAAGQREPSLPGRTLLVSVVVRPVRPAERPAPRDHATRPGARCPGPLRRRSARPPARAAGRPDRRPRTPRRAGPRARPCGAARRPWSARASGGIPAGTPRSGPDPSGASFSAALISSQLVSTSPGVDAVPSAKTCGWRRTSLATMPAATSSMSNGASGSSSATRAWNATWSSTSPSSSTMWSRSPDSSASAGLVRLLDEVGHQAGMRLRPVPGAAAGRAEPVHDRHEVEQAGARDVVRAEEHLHLGRLAASAPVSRDTSAATTSVRPGSPSDEPTQTTWAPAAARRTRLTTEDDRRGLRRRLDVDPGVAQGVDLRLALVAQDDVGGLERLPRLAAQQTGRDARTGEEQDEATRHCPVGVSVGVGAGSWVGGSAWPRRPRSARRWA